MPIVGFISEKGGVGKTTACYHIAVALRRFHGKRVLVVDADYQRGGISCRFIPTLLEDFRKGEVPGTTLYHKFQDLYSEKAFTPHVDILQTQEGVDLLPADPRLAQVRVEKMPPSHNFRDAARKMWNHLSLIKKVLTPLEDSYDYILIDSHPEVSETLRTVIYACDYVVSPVKLDLQSTIGVPSAREAIKEVNDDVELMKRAVDDIGEREPTQFSGAIGMMAREYGEALKQTEQTQYARLQISGGIFKGYVTEGDGLRQAAEQRIDVYQIDGPNAEKQSEQFQAVTIEFLEKCPV